MTDSDQPPRPRAETLGHRLGIAIKAHQKRVALMAAWLTWYIILLVSVNSPSLWSKSEWTEWKGVLIFVIFILSPFVYYIVARAAIHWMFLPRTGAEAKSQRVWEGVVVAKNDIVNGQKRFLEELETLQGVVIGVVVIGLVIWGGSALFSNAPWWAAVIIVLLVILILK